MSYVIRSKHTDEYVRGQFGNTLRWTEHALLAHKYDSASGAATAAIRLGISAGTVEIAEVKDGAVVALHDMRDRRPRAYFGGGRA